MSKPPSGNNQMIQLLYSLIWVTHSNTTKNKADAEPENSPIKAHITIH